MYVCGKYSILSCIEKFSLWTFPKITCITSFIHLKIHDDLNKEVEYLIFQETFLGNHSLDEKGL